jgi:predicted porin
MKKSLIALAALAATGIASAQSSVTLFGIVDTAITHYSVGGGGASWTGMTTSGYNSSQLGFRGREDLGGGLAAGFWIEGGITTDDGATALAFTRRSIVSLSGGWGEVRLGREYTPTFSNDSAFDPFGTNGVGTNVILRGRSTSSGNALTSGAAGVNTTAVRASNSISYFLPANLGGFYGNAMYAFHENNSLAAVAGDNGEYMGARLGYAAGPFNVAFSLGRKEGAAVPTAALPEINTWSLGGSWNFGVGRLMGEYLREKYQTAAAVENTLTGYLIGGLIPMGPGEIRLAYSRVKMDLAAAGADPSARQIALGYVHNLSKRTALYATYARISNRDGAALVMNFAATGGLANARVTGYDLGIRHTF